MRKAVFGFFLVSLLFGSEKSYVVGFVQDSLENSWRVAQVEQFKAALSVYDDIVVKVVESGGSTALQIANIEEMAGSGIDLLVTSPRDAEAMTPVIRAVYRRGTPVVLLSRGVEGPDYTAYLHPDDYAIGQASARFIAKKLKGEGTVLMLKGVPRATTAINRSGGFMAVIKQYPKIKVIERTANYLSGDAIKETEEVILRTIPDAVYAQNDAMAIGAIMALKAHGIDPKKLVITGIDYISDVKELIQKGELDVTFTYPTAGKEGAKAVRKILDGKKVVKEVIIDSVMITRENIGQYKPVF